MSTQINSLNVALFFKETIINVFYLWSEKSVSSNHLQCPYTVMLWFALHSNAMICSSILEIHNEAIFSQNTGFQVIEEVS